MKQLHILIILIISISLCACMDCTRGEGEPVKEDRVVLDFEVLKLDCSADLIIYDNLLSKKNKVIVSAQENLLPFILTKNEGKKLIIDTEGCTISNEAIVIEVYSNGFYKLIHDGSGDISSNNSITAENFEIRHDGSGEISMTLKCGNLKLKHDGSGDIILKGVAEEMDMLLDGSGDIDAFKFIVNKAKVNSDGSGDISVFVKESLDVKLDGSGDVNYKGSPQEIKQSNDGSGEIVSKD